jgi:hypothetical protein
MDNVITFLRKVATDITEDYKHLGANAEVISEFNTHVQKLSDADVEKGFQTFYKTPGKFLFGRIPLQFFMQDVHLREKYKRLFSSYDITETEEVTPMVNPMEMLGLGGGEIASLTKEVLAEMPSPSQMGANLDIAALIQNIKQKVETKLESGKFDQNKLQEQAQAMVESLGGADATSKLLSSQLSQLVNMTNQINVTPKATKKKKKN